MAFFDKISGLAKNIGDKTGDAIETGKLNSKISSEKGAINEEYRKIGEFYYNVFAQGGEVAPEVIEFCESAKAHFDAIDAAQAEINKIKEENEQAKAAAEAEKLAAVQAAAQAKEQAANAPNLTCSKCGAVNPAGTKFCAECGNKLEAPAPAAPSGVCPNCGAQNAPGTKFCAECGTKLEAPAPAPTGICPNCGAQNAPGTKFCSECGSAVAGTNAR